MSKKEVKQNTLREPAKKQAEVTEEMWLQVNEDYRLIVDEFISVQDLSPASRKQYTSVLRQFGWYLFSSMNDKPFYKITKRDFLRYLSFIRDNRKMSSSAISLRKSVVSSLCNHIENIIADEEENYKGFRNFTRGLPAIARNRVYEKVKVTKDEYDSMMKILEEDQNWLGMAWLATAFLVGARRSEIIQFKSEIMDYKVPEGQNYVLSHVVRGKGPSTDGKPLEYMVPLEVLPYWQKWIDTRGYESDYVFTTRYGNEIKAMSSAWANDFCTNVLSDMLERRINVHIFKNSCITYLLESGVPMHLVSKYVAHHNDISTTQIYDLRDFEEEKNQIF
ncbi:site-specific integrase [Paenibacillus sp. 1781tsa1]|uniref:tyrosine-type recombinase/integrase n=1 Tax=Paenibacillus sp. 1781tsa1 TaxID=2953810 RepID=UPI00209E888D|nr:site-specific integrase [Paenibacillus sp. 1781tsa1]MCP1185096.1 tyrosine-type recombinase/integrase [Paenibacillus sp. 1781tsa1]